jgi:hypothetical protein
MRVLDAPQDTLAEWVLTNSGGSFLPGIATAIVLGDEEGEPLAGVAFTDCNGRNISGHIYIKDRRATILLLTLVGGYIFDQLKCSRLTLIAEESNLEAVKLHEKLGAVREGRLVGAGRRGDDILISRLTPDARIWRKLRERRDRQLEGA